MLDSIKSCLHRTPYSAADDGFIPENRKILIISVTIYLCALFLRSWQNILNPGLYMEDATHYFNIYYGYDRELGFILQHPNGYYNLVNNFVAWLTAQADVRLQPLFYHSFALLVGIATATCFSFTGIIRSRAVLIVTPIVLGLSGMNHIYYYNSLTFQMYNVVVLLLCLLFLPIPRSWLPLALLCVLSTVLVWSGPYSVVALPVSLLLLILFRNREKTILLVLVIVNVLLYSLSVRESTIRLYNITDAGLRRIAAQVLVEKVFFLELLGSMSALKVTILLLLLASTLYLLRKNVYYLKVSLVFFAIILGALAPLFLSVKFPLYQTVFPCHIYISQFFWLCFVLFSVDTIIRTLDLKPAAQLLIPVLFGVLVVVDNVRHPAKGHKDVMTTIPAFVRTIHLVEQLELEKKNEYVVVKTENVIPKYLPPMVRVGSHAPDARRLGRDDIPIASGKQFIVD